MIKFFISVKTSLWITGLGIGVFLAGSFFIPQNLDVFSEINDMPLFAWLARNTAYSGKVFWIYLLLLLMSLLAVNMLACGIDSIRRSMTAKQVIAFVSPQILHLGVLFVLFGHLISSVSGYREDITLDLHEVKEIHSRELKLGKVEFMRLPGEDSIRSRVSLLLDGNEHVLEPARPAFYRGTEYFVKSAHQGKNTVIIGLVYDPGVLFQIIGAVVFVLGAGGLFYQQVSRTGQRYLTSSHRRTEAG